MGRDGSGNRVIDGVGPARFARERAVEDERDTAGGGPPTSVRNAFTGIVTELPLTRDRVWQSLDATGVPSPQTRGPGPLRSAQCGENLGADGQGRLRRGAGADVESDRAVNAAQLLLGEPRLCEGFGAAGLGTA